MSAPVPLRSDFDAALLRKLARGSGDPDQTRRLLALAEIYEGGSRSDAARIGGVGLQIVRDWVLRFNAKGPNGLLTGKAPGAPSILDGRQREALRQVVEDGSDPSHPWCRTLAADRSGAMGLRRVPGLDLETDAEPRIAGYGLSQAVGTAAPSRARHGSCGCFQKNFSATVEEIAARQARGKPVEIWFQDEARVGQKNKITRRWAKRGTRPSAPCDQRTASAYIFGAICPAEGKGAGLVLPSCNSEAMALHLAEVSLAVAPGAHALVLLDQAGWHVSKKLPVPGNITLVPLPPKSPELKPVENIWQFMRDNWLSNRIFQSYDDILDHCCFAWNRLIDMPRKIMSIGTREWAYRS